MDKILGSKNIINKYKEEMWRQSGTLETLTLGRYLEMFKVTAAVSFKKWDAIIYFYDNSPIDLFFFEIHIAHKPMVKKCLYNS